MTTKMIELQASKSTLFINLFNGLKKEADVNLQHFINGFADTDTPKTVEELLKSWYYSSLMTKGSKGKIWDYDSLKIYLIARKQKELGQTIVKQLEKLQTIEKAPDLLDITFSVEWKKSRMWGNNPSCEAKEHTTDRYNYYNSGSIGGCGYDKESTAIAQAANQSNSFLKALYQIKEANPTIDNRELFGYGSGYGILPHLEGGVGVSCYPKIFNKIGFKWQQLANGKSFDVYSATRLV